MFDFIKKLFKKPDQKAIEKPVRLDEVWLQRELDKHPDTIFGIPGWKQLAGTLPGGNHGYGCQCWSCLSQLVDPPG